MLVLLLLACSSGADTSANTEIPTGMYIVSPTNADIVPAGWVPVIAAMSFEAYDEEDAELLSIHWLVDDQASDCPDTPVTLSSDGLLGRSACVFWLESGTHAVFARPTRNDIYTGVGASVTFTVADRDSDTDF